MLFLRIDLSGESGDAISRLQHLILRPQRPTWSCSQQRLHRRFSHRLTEAGWTSADGSLASATTPHGPYSERPLAVVSRSLVIKDPKYIVDVDSLYQFLSSKMTFQTQDVYVAEVNAKKRVIEWAFGSYRGQAQAAKMVLRTEYPKLILRYGENSMAVACAERTEENITVVPTAILPSAKAVVHEEYNDEKREVRFDLKRGTLTLAKLGIFLGHMH